jgi:hypothetical protein
MLLKSTDRHVTASFRFACTLEILKSVIGRRKKMDSNLQLRSNFILYITIIYVKFINIKMMGSRVRLYCCPHISSKKTLNEFGLNWDYRERSWTRFWFIWVQYNSSYTYSSPQNEYVFNMFHKHITEPKIRTGLVVPRS